MRGHVDVNVPRFNQLCVAVLTGLAFVVQAWPLVAIVAVIAALLAAGAQKLITGEINPAVTGGVAGALAALSVTSALRRNRRH